MTSAEVRAELAFKAIALLAIDPFGLGGAVLRGGPGPTRDLWLDTLRGILPSDAPWRRMPPRIAEARLLGGLDLSATLAAGRPIAEQGLLTQASGGVLVVPMAERLEANVAGQMAATLDTGEVIVERDGIAVRAPGIFATILLDEGLDDEAPPGTLTERLAFSIAIDAISPRDGDRAIADISLKDVAAARELYPSVKANDDTLEALVATTLAFGVSSLRIATLALRAAKASAALSGRRTLGGEDIEIAAALVIAPRATRLPAVDEPDDADAPESPPENAPDPSDADAPNDPGDTKPMAEQVVEATRAAIPADLLARLNDAALSGRSSARHGRGGPAHSSARRGRPAGVRRGSPKPGVRLAVVETLRAAAPWQKLRRVAAPKAASRVQVRREDFRVGRFKERNETLTIFAVDASGSAALHRLAEVKGAVELILAECYVRRDSVALIAFRGERAELVLPPTRSLTRAKRVLAGQPGGGGTPLAAAIDAASLLAQSARKKGLQPLLVLMTDGKANISRTGQPGRAAAETDAMTAAQAFRLGGLSGLVLDIAPRPGDAPARLAAAMGARYMPLPYADARVLSRAVLAAAPSA